MTAIRHTGFMMIRQARNLQREPIWIVMMIIQPMVWLLLYGQLFRRLPNLGPGFGTSEYIEFLTPGIVVMNAFFGGTWAGMAMITDLDRNVIERFLATPVSRISLVLSQLVRAVKPGARLVLLGDAEQLPSVDAGAVLRDLVPPDATPVPRPWDALVPTLEHDGRVITQSLAIIEYLDEIEPEPPLLLLPATPPVFPARPLASVPP